MRLPTTARVRAAIVAATVLTLVPVTTGIVLQVGETDPPVPPRARAATSYPEPAPSPMTWAVSELVDTAAAPELEALTAGNSRSGGKQAPGKVRIRSGKGNLQVWTASAMSDHGVPLAAEQAYRRAARTMASTDPACQLPWTLLAAIGRVESDHGRYGGSRLGTDGVSRPRIIGIQLNGHGPVAAIRDTDNGRLDRDKVWDRAVGPMQFIPSTWATAARDGDGDGRISPHDLDDAALAAGGYLCAGSGSVLGAGMGPAIFSYNHDDYYVALVTAFERGYRTGVFVMPPPPVEEKADKDRKKKRDKAKKNKHKKKRKQAAGTGAGKAGGKQAGPGPKAGASTKTPDPKPAPKPTPKPDDKPSPKPSPTPKPTPKPEPEPETVTGTFTECNGGYCLGGMAVDLGQASASDKQAAGDYDGDGATETNGQEVAGMLGTSVTMVVVKKTGAPAGVYSINGIAVG